MPQLQGLSATPGVLEGFLFGPFVLALLESYPPAIVVTSDANLVNFLYRFYAQLVSQLPVVQ